MGKKVEIEFDKGKLVKGNIYKSYIEMCRELNVLINGVPCVKSAQIGSRKSAITDKISEYADITITQEKKGGNEKIIIDKITYNQKIPPIADLLRSFIREMVNDEYQDVSIFKYHNGLTVELGYLGKGYGKLYNVLYREKEKQDETFTAYGIRNDEDYTKNLIRKLKTKIDGHLKTCCGNLDYENVYTYKMPMNLTAKLTDYEFLDFSDKKIYDEFKKEAKAEIDEEMKEIKERYEKKGKKLRINYKEIPIRASKRFNQYKKSLDPKYKPIKVTETWIFEVDGNFQPTQQTLYPKALNRAILKGFLKLIKYQALLDYTETEEYKRIKAENNYFTEKSGLICSDKEVRQALTIKNRDKTAEKKEIEEEHVRLDFSLLNIESYLSDIQVFIKACKI